MKFFSYFITLLFLLILSGIAVFFYGLWYFGKDLPDYKELSKYNPNVVTRIHAGNGALLAEYATQKRVFVPISVIPKKVINAFISAEDKDFYNHFGIDLLATLRALITNLKNTERGLFSVETKRNLITNSAEFYDLSYEYFNDCLRAGLVYRREFYNDSELEPENSLMFNITLSNFGNVNSPKISR